MVPLYIKTYRPEERSAKESAGVFTGGRCTKSPGVQRVATLWCRVIHKRARHELSSQLRFAKLMRPTRRSELSTAHEPRQNCCHHPRRTLSSQRLSSREISVHETCGKNGPQNKNTLFLHFLLDFPAKTCYTDCSIKSVSSETIFFPKLNFHHRRKLSW